MQLISRFGQNYADNIADEYLAFQKTNGWVANSRTGAISIDLKRFFSGDKSLKVNVTDLDSDFVFSNPNQVTTINQDGNYSFSFYIYKTEVDYEVNGDVKIFKNASLLDTQVFKIGSTNSDEDISNNWIRLDSDVSYNMTLNDEITFSFTVYEDLATSLTELNLWFGGFMVYNQNRMQIVSPKFTKSINTVESRSTGGAQYIDSQYTSGSPLVITEGNTAKLTCNNSVIIDNNVPTDFADGMWSSLANKLVAVNEKDWFDLEVRFKAKNSENNGYFDIMLDIGGSLGEIRRVTKDFLRLSGTEQSFAIPIQYYTGSTFVANGCDINIEATKGDISIYDIELLPFRKHKGY